MSQPTPPATTTTRGPATAGACVCAVSAAVCGPLTERRSAMQCLLLLPLPLLLLPAMGCCLYCSYCHCRWLRQRCCQGHQSVLPACSARYHRHHHPHGLHHLHHPNCCSCHRWHWKHPGGQWMQQRRNQQQLHPACWQALPPYRPCRRHPTMTQVRRGDHRPRSERTRGERECFLRGTRACRPPPSSRGFGTAAWQLLTCRALQRLRPPQHRLHSLCCHECH